jgi:hypothetical protein
MKNSSTGLVQVWEEIFNYEATDYTDFTEMTL